MKDNTYNKELLESYLVAAMDYVCNYCGVDKTYVKDKSILQMCILQMVSNIFYNKLMVSDDIKSTLKMYKNELI